MASVPLPWVPEGVSDIWRLMIVVLGALYAGWFVAEFRRSLLDHDQSWGLIIGRLALALFVARSAVVQIEHWRTPVVLEGLPISTVAVALAYTSMILRRHAPRPSVASRYGDDAASEGASHRGAARRNP